MKPLMLAGLGIAALLASASFAEAADGCGRGFYWNGYRCAPMRYGPPPVVREYYEGPRYYEGRRYYAPRGPNCYAGGCCPPHYTIQDGVCKPYRGF